MSFNEGVKPSELAKIENAAWLNNRFKSGATAWDEEALHRIQLFDRPIVFDLNGTLASDHSPLEANPEAIQAMNHARQVGSVFIVTKAEGWEAIHAELQRIGLWHEDIVLISRENFRLQEVEMYMDLRTPDYYEAVKNFIELAKARGLELTEDNFNQPPSAKRVAPLFGKPFDIPLIDDDTYLVNKDPGMLVLNTNGYLTSDEVKNEYPNTPFPIYSPLDAVNEVAKYYSTMPNEVFKTRLPLVSGQKIPDKATFVPRIELLFGESENLQVITTFKDLEAMLAEETGGKIPEPLIELFGLNRLNWYRIARPDCLSTLWTGFMSKLESRTEKAQSSIELTRYTDHSRDEIGTVSSKPDTVFPDEIAVAGVHPEVRRVVGITYDAKSLYLHKAKFFVPDTHLKIVSPYENIRALDVNTRWFYGERRWYLGNTVYDGDPRNYIFDAIDDPDNKEYINLETERMKIKIPVQLERVSTPQYPYITRTGK